MESSRRQLPPQIKKVAIVERRTGKTIVRYRLTADAGINPETGRRQQVRRHFATEKEARDALGEITAAATIVSRKTVTVEQMCEDWLAPLRERHGDLAAQKLTRPHLDKLLIELRDGGSKTARGRARRAWSARSLNKAVDAWRTMLAYGVERRELSHNVAAAMKKVPRPRAEVKTYTPG